VNSDEDASLPANIARRDKVIIKTELPQFRC